MGYEINFMQVGGGSKNGDAIALRWGDLHKNDHYIAVIDAGFSGGSELAGLINAYYGFPQTIDLVVSTHPGAGHIGGLPALLDSFEVKKLWMHLPWEHNRNIASKFKDGEADESMDEGLKNACSAAWNLYTQAVNNGVDVEEPFSCRSEMFINNRGGQLRILNPTEEYYEELLPEFGIPPPPEGRSMPEIIADAGKKTINTVKEIWHKDSISDNGKTSAQNNSAVILEFVYDNKRFLFTADGGIPALMRASARAGKEELKMVQIPNHGDRRNVGPMALNKFVGYIAGKSAPKNITAVVSCAPKNIDKRVLNAFKRRGCRCFNIKEHSLRQHNGAPRRKEHTLATAHDFFHETVDKE